MERLTTKRKDGRWAIRNDDGATPLEQINKIPIAIDRLAAYEDTGLEPEEIDSEFINQVIEENRRLKELAQAEKDGRLVMLPCKVGDTVYEVNKRGFISTYKVISIHIQACSVLIGWELIEGTYSNLNGFEISALDKTVFLTREEAEAALKKREEVGNGPKCV